MALDDTTIYIIVDLPEEAARILNTDLQTISHWANNWLVLFKENKTLSIFFSRKINPINHPSIFVIDTVIDEITSQKH